MPSEDFEQKSDMIQIMLKKRRGRRSCFRAVMLRPEGENCGNKEIHF